MKTKLNLAQLDPQGKKVLMRVDFNVPLDQDGHITDDTRIRAALPSIEMILEKGGSLILMSHLGRPKGQVDPTFSLRPAADRLAELISVPVKFAGDTVGPDAEKLAEKLQPGEVLVLENLRFNKGETDNAMGFSRALSGLADTYVNDAFGTAHRAHASTAGVTEHFKECYAGFLMEKELKNLGTMVANPERPFVAVLGGAKVKGKVDVILNLLGEVDSLLLGGGMIFTFFKVHGLNVGTSLIDEDSIDMVKQIMEKAKDSNTELILPEDCMVSTDFSEQGEKKVVLVTDIPDQWMGLDIGPTTIKRYEQVLGAAKSIFWNGPMGVFEMPSFAAGTRALGQAVADATAGGALSVVGGGDSVAALNQLNLASGISHVSTGGGASLEFMAGCELPGVAALSDA